MNQPDKLHAPLVCPKLTSSPSILVKNQLVLVSQEVAGKINESDNSNLEDFEHQRDLFLKNDTPFDRDAICGWRETPQEQASWKSTLVADRGKNLQSNDATSEEFIEVKNQAMCTLSTNSQISRKEISVKGRSLTIDPNFQSQVKDVYSRRITPRSKLNSISTLPRIPTLNQTSSRITILDYPSGNRRWYLGNVKDIASCRDNRIKYFEPDVTRGRGKQSHFDSQNASPKFNPAIVGSTYQKEKLFIEELRTNRFQSRMSRVKEDLCKSNKDIRDLLRPILGGKSFENDLRVCSTEFNCDMQSPISKHSHLSHTKTNQTQRCNLARSSARPFVNSVENTLQESLVVSATQIQWSKSYLSPRIVSSHAPLTRSEIPIQDAFQKTNYEQTDNSVCPSRERSTIVAIKSKVEPHLPITIVPPQYISIDRDS